LTFHLSDARNSQLILTAAISRRMAAFCCCERAERRLGVCARLAAAMPDRREASRIEHEMLEA
jgi:hypothetical protein